MKIFVIIVFTVAVLVNVFVFFILKNIDDEKLKRIKGGFFFSIIVLDVLCLTLFTLTLRSTNIRSVHVSYHDENGIITLVDDEDGKAYERMKLDNIMHLSGSYEVGSSAYLIVSLFGKPLFLCGADDGYDIIVPSKSEPTTEAVEAP